MTGYAIVFLAGILAAGAAMVIVMRTKMVQRHRVAMDFDAACREFEAAVADSDRWTQPLPGWDMGDSLRKNGFDLGDTKRLQVFFVCKAPHANRILSRYPEMASMMPCSWAVFERSDGSVWVAKLNIGLMSKMFLGNVIGTVMGTVSREESGILSRLTGPECGEANALDTSRAQA